MKYGKIIYTVGFAVVCLAVIGCSRAASRQNINEPKAILIPGYDPASDGVEFRLLEEKYDHAPEKATLRITNNSEGTIQFGAPYTIEKLYDGEWTEMEFPEGIAFIAIMYILEPGNSKDYQITLYPDRFTYDPGYYRIRKNIWINDENVAMYAPFYIEHPDNEFPL